MVLAVALAHGMCRMGHGDCEAFAPLALLAPGRLRNAPPPIFAALGSSTGLNNELGPVGAGQWVKSIDHCPRYFIRRGALSLEIYFKPSSILSVFDSEISIFPYFRL